MEGKEGEGAWRARGAAVWQAPHRDHILVIEVYRMVIKLKGALISLPQPKCLSEERSVWTGSAGQQGWEQVGKEKGYCEKKPQHFRQCHHTLLGNYEVSFCPR